MIAALMLYSIAVTLLLAVAAVAAEHLLRLTRRPARFVWTVAMASAVGLSVARIPAALARPEAQGETASLLNDLATARQASWSPPRSVVSGPPVRKTATTIVAPSLAAPTVPISASSAVARFDRPLAVMWAVLSLVFLGVITLSAIRLARANRRWTTTAVDGVPVLVSHDLGPAVIGILRYSIVLPQWSLELPAADREMILAHEREHARTGDPSLLFLSTLVVALMPWNAGLWWIARRMRYAIELDCDARVLRHRDPRAYGALLLDVSERTMGGAVPLAAMAEPVSLIERRIAAMTARVPRFAVLRASVAALAAIALVIVACSTPHPTPAPAPATPVVPPQTETVTAVAADPVPVPRTPAELRKAPPRLSTTGVAVDSSQRTQVNASTDNAHDDSLLALLRARRDSASRLLAYVDSAEKILWSHGLEASVEAERLAMANGRLPIGGSGGSVGGMPPTGSGVASGVRGRGTFAGLLPSDTGPAVAVGRLNESAGLRRDGASGTAVAGGVDIGRDYSSRRSARIIEIARQTAERLFPEAFQAHEGQFALVTVVFDSTGTVVKTGRGTRAPLPLDGRIADRDVLRATLPGVPIETFSEWGMANLTTASQSRGSGVMLLYAFMK